MDTHTYKEQLLAEKTRIEADLSAIGRKTGIPEDWEATPEYTDVLRSDASEVADESEEYQSRIAVNATLEDSLREINNALARIDDDTYGACIVCGARIEEDRLSANPAATTCKTHVKNNL